MVKLSVIVPVYNVGKYLEEALLSVVNQSFQDIEVICVNDGSTDNSPEILEKFALNDSRIKIFTKTNGGCGSARNFALEKVKGDYIYFFDPDDKLPKETFKKAYNNASLNNSDIVVFKATTFMEDNLSDGEVYFNLDKNLKQKNYDRFTFDYSNIPDFILGDGFAPWSKLYKKEFLKSYNDFKFDENIAFDDVTFHIKSLLRAKTITYVDEILYYYRTDNLNSVNNTSKNGFDIFKVADNVEKILTDENCFDEFKNRFYTFKINHILAYIISTNSPLYYKKARCEFLKMDLSNISQNKDKFDLVINIEDYDEFKKEFLNIEINRLKSIVDSLKKENSHLNDEYKQLKKLNNELLSSRSWKLTEPLRKLKRWCDFG